MRLAAFSDVHGNLPALGAVLADIKSQGVDAVVNLGDNLAGPIEPAACADVLMSLDALNVRGNHDRWMLDAQRLDPVDRFASRSLSDEHRAWLAALPATAMVGGEIFLCHGTPTSDEGIWLDAWWHQRRTTLPSETAVEAEAEGLDVPVILCGHTHVARAVRLRDGRQIINPGSVGLQIVHGSPDARYALLERRNGQWSVSFRIVGYDTEAAAIAAERNGFGHWREALTTGWADPEGLF